MPMIQVCKPGRKKEGAIMGKAFILWLLGVPFTLLAILWFFGVFR